MQAKHVLIDEGLASTITEDEAKAGLAEETLYICVHRHVSITDFSTIVYHRKERPVG